MTFPKNALLFAIGGGCYTGLEFLWRGRSHWSMFVLGGGCFLAIGKLNRRFRLSVPGKMVTGSLICTAGELVTGLLLNRDHQIWDYTGVPLNFRGQICLPFTLLWMPLSLAAGCIYEAAEGWLAGR